MAQLPEHYENTQRHSDEIYKMMAGLLCCMVKSDKEKDYQSHSNSRDEVWGF